jgi:hypothetical protein
LAADVYLLRETEGNDGFVDHPKAGPISGCSRVILTLRCEESQMMRRVVVTAVLAATAAATTGVPSQTIRIGDEAKNVAFGTTQRASAGEVFGAGHAVPNGTVTLITGDQVQVRSGAGGKPGVEIHRGPGRGHVAFFRQGGGDDVRVVPSDAAGLVAQGRLDPRLFDVSYLLSEHFDDAHQSGVPLITSYDDAGRGRQAVASARRMRALPAVGGDLLNVPRSGTAEFWKSLAASQGRTGARTFAGGVRKVWLDGRMHATLDQSVPQIGAPEAWQAGYTGKGVTVAVLDTGYDQNHPDLKGAVKEAEDFTGSDSGVQDKVGHGTHVSSILAGRGTASDGKYTGVAKDAQLVEGKVLGDFGSGSDSQIIAGMEWAAQRAKVINMSVGAPFPDTPEIDPVEEAVNRLTQQTGALFVIAAGNIGSNQPGNTVTSPASADAALAVAAVDKKDAVASFSSHGPWLDDNTTKPDITAPGADIVAARAEGSDLGTPVGASYQSLSGTSMATPHVAGAAAILAQQHPDWKADEIKAALIGSAKRLSGTTPLTVGAGRVDVASAVTQQVHGMTPSVSFGFLKWPDADVGPVHKTVTYRNEGITPVTLDLAVQVSGENGEPAPEGTFTVDTSQLTVPAQGTATADLTMTPAKGPSGLYDGYLRATAGQISMQTPVGGFKEPESYDLGVEARDRAGDTPVTDAVPAVEALNLETRRIYTVNLQDGTGKARVPAGHYQVISWIPTPDSAGPDNPSYTLVVKEVTLDAARTVTLDARPGEKLQVTVPHKDAVPADFKVIALSHQGALRINGFNLTPWGETGSFAPDTDIYLVAAKMPGTNAVFSTDLAQSWTWPDSGAPSSYAYHLTLPFSGAIPANPVYHLDSTSLATVKVQVNSQNAKGPIAREEVASDEFEIGPSLSVPVPSTTTHYVTTGTKWERTVAYEGADGSFLDALGARGIREYRAGMTYTERWNTAAIGPAFCRSPDRGGDPYATREGDELVFTPSPFSDGDPDHCSTVEPVDATGTYTLRSDGTLVGTKSYPDEDARFTVPAGNARYTLTLDMGRSASWTTLATHVATTWNFATSTDGDETRGIPLMAIRTAPPTDEYDRAAAGHKVTMPVWIDRAAEPAPGTTVKHLELEVSFDDGKTWRPAKVSPSGSGWKATVDHPAGAGYVSLRAAATDTTGDGVDQEVIRAYALR